MKIELVSARRALVVAAETGDDPEALLEAVAAGRDDPACALVVLDLRGAEGLGLALTPGNLLPPALWARLQEGFGVAPEDAPLDRELVLLLDEEGLRTAGYLGYEDCWRLATALDDALAASPPDEGPSGPAGGQG